MQIPSKGVRSVGVSAVRGVFWTGGGQAVRQVVQIVTSVLLARLLAPDDFGLLGMTMVFVGVAQLFTSFGIGSAIIQARDADPAALSSAFWLNVSCTSVVALSLIFGAPLVSAFYKDPRIAPLVATLSLTLLLSGVSVIPDALLLKSMGFAALARIQVLSSSTGAVVAIFMAWQGWGVWSLVAQPIVGNLTALSLTWRAAAWRPDFTFSWSRVSGLVRFSADMLGSNLINYANRSVDILLIGRVLGETALGYYSLASQIMVYPLANVSAVIVRVLFPTLSSLQDEEERFRKAHLKATQAIALVTFPMMLGLLAVSDEFIRVVLGDKWLPSEIVLRVFCLLGMLQSVNTTSSTLLLALGQTRTLLRLAMLTTPLLVGSFAVGLPWGIEGVAVSYALVSLVCFYIVQRVALRFIGLRLSDVWAVLWRTAAASCGMFVVVAILVSSMQDVTPVLRLCISVPTGVVVYGLLAIVVDRDNVQDLVRTLRSAMLRS